VVQNYTILKFAETNSGLRTAIKLKRMGKYEIKSKGSKHEEVRYINL
jgi:hypothetical protein